MHFPNPPGRVVKFFLVVALFVTVGCTKQIIRTGVALLYEPAKLPAAQILKDICYTPDSKCDGPRQTLDLYRPSGNGWPLIIFVHGGSWRSGDKNLSIGKADVYGNVGRFYAAHGIGVAVINYRLQPNVQWSDQVTDVLTALHWARSQVSAYGGNADAIYLMGHSAGAHLASYAALKSSKESGRSAVKGVIAVSGAAYDMNDSETYRLGADRNFYQSTFEGLDRSPNWSTEGSVVSQLNAAAPPFLVFYAARESKALQRQSHVFYEALNRAGIESHLQSVPKERHMSIVLTLSRDDKTVGPAVLKFVKG